MTMVCTYVFIRRAALMPSLTTGRITGPGREE
jgi:hypothetical protein